MPDKPDNLLRRDTWLGRRGESSRVYLDLKGLWTQPSEEHIQSNPFAVVQIATWKTGKTPGPEGCDQQHKVQLAASYT